MRHHSLIVCLLSLPIVACAPAEQKPSYADLVAIYGSETQELDRLQRKRAEMVAEYEATLQPSGEEALEALTGLIGGLGDDAAAEAEGLDTADPNELLDRAIANAENLDSQADALIDAVASSAGKAPSDRAAIEAMYSEEFKAKLAKLDAEIEAQSQRVDKARAARDAAEAE